MQFTKFEEFGYQNEKELKPIIEKYLNIELMKTDRYNKFDFIATGADVEAVGVG